MRYDKKTYFWNEVKYMKLKTGPDKINGKNVLIHHVSCVVRMVNRDHKQYEDVGRIEIMQDGRDYSCIIWPDKRIRFLHDEQCHPSWIAPSFDFAKKSIEMFFERYYDIISDFDYYNFTEFDNNYITSDKWEENSKELFFLESDNLQFVSIQKIFDSWKCIITPINYPEKSKYPEFWTPTKRVGMILCEAFLEIYSKLWDEYQNNKNG